MGRRKRKFRIRVQLLNGYPIDFLIGEFPRGGSTGRACFSSMIALTEKDKPIAQMLLDFGACPRCVFRLCRVGLQASYRHPHKELLSELLEFLGNDKDEQKLSCETETPPSKRIKLESTKEASEEQIPNGSHQQASVEDDGNRAAENLRPAVCNVCLGIMQELCEMEFVKSVCHKINSSEYQFFSFVFSVSFPPQLSVREHAAWLLVKEEMGATACPNCFKPAKNKQSVFTRMAVVKALDMISEEDFRKNFLCPPSSPKIPCTAVDVQCTNGSVYVAGRYNKYSRTLPQTPWIIDGERKMESSVEELILEHLMVTFKADSFNFSSSGREDVDVRTLGNGRPFAIELINPRRVHLTAAEMKVLQQTINNSSDKVQVRDLQLVTREAIGHMKEGEEEKTKTYSALIWTEKVIRSEDIAFLDNMQVMYLGWHELKLDQKTPLRVLHRRPLAVRVRHIHTMRSEYIDEHHFRLRLKTQAGTCSYIKEFVHGDFGRTKPNICSLLGTTADILELDVESVDIDWPPALED
ncbi:hypothetical protein lerEdw1_019089 [Lerista edwardsae]|nr:hypothetical protein lerEdw1_019089 [Lerista edwardsae]